MIPGPAGRAFDAWRTGSRTGSSVGPDRKLSHEGAELDQRRQLARSKQKQGRSRFVRWQTDKAMKAHPDLRGFGAAASDAGGCTAKWCHRALMKGTVDH